MKLKHIWQVFSFIYGLENVKEKKKNLEKFLHENDRD